MMANSAGSLPPPDGIQNAEALFVEVSKNFREALSPLDKSLFKEFNSPTSLVRELQANVEQRQSNGKLSSLCRRIERLSTTLGPFFDVINIFVSSNPEFSALVWGAIRFVFILGSNYITFLEKLIVMFERICERLPGYSEYYDRIVARYKNPALSTNTPDGSLRHTRIVKTLSYIYADIIEFCQKACKLFAAKRHGVRYKVSAITDVFWTPFDERFAAILHKLQSHQDLFRDEMHLEESLYIEQQFQKRDIDSEITKETLESLQEQLKGLKKMALEGSLHVEQKRVMENETTEQIQESFRNQLNDLKDTIERLEGFVILKFKGLGFKKPSTNQMPYSTKILLFKIKTWINSPNYMRQYEKAQGLRLHGTGTWFTDSESYKQFKSFDGVFDHEGILPLEARRILFVRAKPGYGKTVLSQILIDDLKSTPKTDISTDSPRQEVLFYHFDSERLDYCAPTHAIRAALLQLVHINHADQDILDSLSILIDNESSGQLVGSDEDVQQALYLHLKKTGRATLVLDGIDECSSPTILLQMMHELCHNTGTKALLLGRPTLTLPSNFKCFVPLDLEYWQNAEDIRNFLTPEVRHVHEDGLFGKDANCSQICSMLVAKSQGMFLWAHLMIEYLRCEVLSPAERLEAIFADGVVEGLEKVYEKILQALARAVTKERFKVRKMFELICIAERPFNIPELRTILAVNPGKVTREIDLIVRFLEVLPKMSGSLVEVDQQGSVMFIHSSFREFITSPDHWGRNEFAVNIREAHLSASTLCLSYLIYDAPQGPYSENNLPTSVTIDDLTRRFPLAIYATNSWVYHGELGTTTADAVRGSSFTGRESQFHSMLSNMLSQRIAITSWIQTSWFFGRPPSVQNLVNAQSKISQIYSSDANGGRTVRPTVFQHLEDFSRDLEQLNSEWSYELQEYPAAIWGPSITAFNKSLFWYQTAEMIVQSLAPCSISARKGLTQELVLKSRSVEKDVSLLGTPLIGIVSIVPPMDYLTGEYTSVSASCSWKARYTIKNVDSVETLWNFEFDLPKEDISDMLKKRSPDRLQFPVAISKSLRKMVVLRSVLTIDEENWTIRRRAANAPNAIIQRLEFNSSKARLPEESSHELFYFSGNEDAISLVNSCSTFKRLICIWSCHGSKYTYRGEVSAITYTVIELEKVRKESLFVFHPSLECILFTQDFQLCLWFYNKPDVPIKCWHFPFFIIPLAMESHSVLHYTRYDARYDVLEQRESYVDLTVFFERATPLGESISQEQLGNKSMGAPSIQSALFKSSSRRSVISETRLVHNANGAQSIILRQQHLASLPQVHHNERTSVDLLPLEDGQSHITIVWNKEQQNTYSLSDPQSRHLPSIIKRRLDSKLKRALEAIEEDTAGEASTLQLPGDPKRIRLIGNE